MRTSNLRRRARHTTADETIEATNLPIKLTYVSTTKNHESRITRMSSLARHVRLLRDMRSSTDTRLFCCSEDGPEPSQGMTADTSRNTAKGEFREYTQSTRGPSACALR